MGYEAIDQIVERNAARHPIWSDSKSVHVLTQDSLGGFDSSYLEICSVLVSGGIVCWRVCDLDPAV